MNEIISQLAKDLDDFDYDYDYYGYNDAIEDREQNLEDLKQYLCREDGNDVGVWANEPEDTQKQLYFPSNF